jgi:hypothetical protein
MSFGYPQLYANGLNSNSQLRRSTDLIYQRGATYEVVLTGSTLQTSMELVVDLYSNGKNVGNMTLVPYDISLSGSTYYYKFNIRPYTYFQNYIESEHYQYYWQDDYDTTNDTINVNAPYPNSIKANVKYYYRYYANNQYVNEGAIHDYDHYTLLGNSLSEAGFIPSGFTNTGHYFDMFGGTFQFDNNFFLPNFDQEIGTNMGTGFVPAIGPSSAYSPASRYDLYWPNVPEESDGAKFLTYAPRIQYVQENESYNLWYFNGQSGDRFVSNASYILYDFYDINNNLLERYTQEINKAGTPYESPTGYTDNYRRFALPCGPIDITNLYSGFSFDNVCYYRVQIYDGYPTWNLDRVCEGPISPVSEIFYFYLYNNCRPEDTRLCWLNELGGYDYFTFVSYRQDTKQINRTSYDNRYYATNLASPDRNIGRSNKTFDTNVTQEIVLESDYVNVQTGNWLEGLFLSPQVYIMRNDYISILDVQNKIYKDLRPVQVTSTSVDTITKKHKKLNKYRITLKTGDSYFVAKGF